MINRVDKLSESFVERKYPSTLSSELASSRTSDTILGLRKAVAIPSVSADEERRQDVVKVSKPRCSM